MTTPSRKPQREIKSFGIEELRKTLSHPCDSEDEWFPIDCADLRSLLVDIDRALLEERSALIREAIQLASCPYGCREWLQKHLLPSPEKTSDK